MDGSDGTRTRDLRRDQTRCLSGHQSDYTRTTQALPGASRSQPARSAPKSLLQPAVAVEVVPACHGGGRGCGEPPASSSWAASGRAVVRRGFPGYSRRLDEGIRQAPAVRSDRDCLRHAASHLVQAEAFASVLTTRQAGAWCDTRSRLRQRQQRPCITGASRGQHSASNLQKGGRGEPRMVGPNDADLAKNPAYSLLRKALAKAGAFH
jgi:hypothetical protein